MYAKSADPDATKGHDKAERSVKWVGKIYPIHRFKIEQLAATYYRCASTSLPFIHVAKNPDQKMSLSRGKMDHLGQVQFLVRTLLYEMERLKISTKGQK